MLKRNVALLGMFTALAMIFSYVEALIPVNFGIPGVKLGLANLIAVIMLYKCDLKSTVTVSVVRIILSGALFGSVFSIIYSLAGGMLSVSVMAAAKKTGLLSVCGISMLGGVMHNVGQLVVAALALESFSLAYYAPVLLISGLITGFLVGVLSNEFIKRVDYNKK